jgi:hypothetical protein
MIDSRRGAVVEPARMLSFVYGYFGFFGWSRARRRGVPLP